MGAAASINVEHIPGIKEAYEAKKAEGKCDGDNRRDHWSTGFFSRKISHFSDNFCILYD
jgi:hypothetical protein